MAKKKAKKKKSKRRKRAKRRNPLLSLRKEVVRGAEATFPSQLPLAQPSFMVLFSFK